MSVYAVVFRVADARRKAQLVVRIKAHGPWMNTLDGSVWFVETSLDVHTLRADLASHIVQTDLLLIVRVDPQESDGFLPTQAWDWLNARQY